MSSAAEELLARFASRLSSDYNADMRYMPFSSERSASALAYFLSSSSNLERNFSFPCLSMKCTRMKPRRRYFNIDSDESMTRPSKLNYLYMMINQSAADIATIPSHNEKIDASPQLLSRVMRFDKTTIVMAPNNLLRNFLCSFGHMLELKLRKTLCLLMKKVENKQQFHHKRQELNQPHMMCRTKSWSPFALNNSSSNYSCNLEGEISQQDQIIKAFSTLSESHNSTIVPVAASMHFDAISPNKNYRHVTATHDRYTMSIVFEAEVHIKISNGAYLVNYNFPNKTNFSSPGYIHTTEVFGTEIQTFEETNQVIVTKINAPGYIAGNFKCGKSPPDSVDVSLDTSALYEIMKKECEYVSKRVVKTVLGSEIYALYGNFLSDNKNPSSFILNREGNIAGNCLEQDYLSTSWARLKSSNLKQHEKQQEENDQQQKYNQTRYSMDAIEDNPQDVMRIDEVLNPYTAMALAAGDRKYSSNAHSSFVNADDIFSETSSLLSASITSDNEDVDVMNACSVSRNKGWGKKGFRRNKGRQQRVRSFHNKTKSISSTSNGSTSTLTSNRSGDHGGTVPTVSAMSTISTSASTFPAKVDDAVTFEHPKPSRKGKCFWSFTR